MHLCLMYDKELLKGTLKTMLLCLFEEKGAMYGYEITQTVKQRSQEDIQLTEGALYPSLHKLEDKGFLESFKQLEGGRTRKYYQLTDKGRREAEKAKQSWYRFSGHINQILNA